MSAYIFCIFLGLLCYFKFIFKNFPFSNKINKDYKNNLLNHLIVFLFVKLNYPDINSKNRDKIQLGN